MVCVNATASSDLTTPYKKTVWYKEYRFRIVLAIGVLIECGALFFTGLRGDPYTYGPTMIAIIVIFNIVYMIWPAVQTVISRPTAVIIALRLAIIGGSFIYILALMLIVTRLNTETVGRLFHLPFVGFFLTLGAVVLHALAAFLLVSFGSKEKHAELKALKAKVQPLQASATAQQVQVDNAVKAVDSREARLKVERDLEAIEGQEAAKTLKSHDEAKAEYEANSGVIELAAANKTKAQDADNRARLSDRITLKQAQLAKSGNTAGQIENFTRELGELVSELDDLLVEANKLDARVATLKASAESGVIKSLKDAYDKATEKNRLANEKKAKVMKDVQAADKALKKATNSHATESDVLAEIKKELVTTTENITTLSGAISSVWRDLFVPFIVLVGAFALYPVWYGAGINLPG